MTCTNQYKKFTIRELFNSFEKIMAQSPEITLDSEVIISDLDMQFFNQEIKIYPTRNYKDGTLAVGIYLNPYEREELLKTVPVASEETNTEDLAWLNKYRSN